MPYGYNLVLYTYNYEQIVPPLGTTSSEQNNAQQNIAASAHSLSPGKIDVLQPALKRGIEAEATPSEPVDSLEEEEDEEEAKRTALQVSGLSVSSSENISMLSSSESTGMPKMASVAVLQASPAPEDSDASTRGKPPLLQKAWSTDITSNGESGFLPSRIFVFLHFFDSL